jgi:hypothetical protein
MLLCALTALPRARHAVRALQVNLGLYGRTMAGDNGNGISAVRSMYEDIVTAIEEAYEHSAFRLIDATESRPVWECGPGAAAADAVTPPRGAGRRGVPPPVLEGPE